MLRTLARARPVPLIRAPLNANRFFSKPTGEGEAKPEAAAAEAAADGAPESAQADAADSELSQIRAKLEAKDKECAKFKDAYQRSIADFRNLQKTTEREMQKAKDFAIQKFAKDLVESVDNFDLALGVLTPEKLEALNNKEISEFHQGIKMVQDVFEKTLAKHGLEKMNPVGEKFDANSHEAVFQAPQPDKEPGTVFFVQRTGFKLNDRVLRAPKVGVVAESQ